MQPLPLRLLSKPQRRGCTDAHDPYGAASMPKVKKFMSQVGSSIQRMAAGMAARDTDRMLRKSLMLPSDDIALVV